MYDLSALSEQYGGTAGLLGIGSTLFNVFGSVNKASQESNMYEYEARRAAQQAQTDQEVAAVTAGRLRKAGKAASGAAVANYGASGVDVGSGSASLVVGELSKRIELDALSAMLAGKYKVFDDLSRSGQYGAAADRSRTAGVWGAGSSLLGGFARNQAMKGWGNTGSSNGGGGSGHAQNLSYAPDAMAGE